MLEHFHIILCCVLYLCIGFYVRGQDSLPITLLAAKYKRQVDGNVRLSVTYINTAEVSVQIRWQSLQSKPCQNFQTFHMQLPDDVLETFTVVHEDLVSTTHARFLFDGAWPQTTVAFEGIESANTEGETNLRLPPLSTIEPSGDLVYTEGQNITLNITRPATLLYEFSFQFLLNPQTGHVRYQRISDGPIFNLKEPVLAHGYFERVAVTMKTSSYPTFGQLEMQSATFLSGDVSIFLKLTKGVNVYPSSQTGPFPPDFVGLVVWEGYEVAVRPDGSRVVHCDMNELHCILECWAVGYNEVTVRVVRKSSGQEVGDTVCLNPTHLGDFHSVVKSVKVMEPDGNEEMEPLQCVASDADGNTDMEDVRVIFYKPGKILQDQSNVTLTQAPSQPAIVTMNATCVVEGRPQPNVTFLIYQIGGYAPDDAPDEVVDLGNFHFRVSKFVTYDVTDPWNYETEDPYEAEVERISCSLDQKLEGDLNYHEFHILNIPPLPTSVPDL